MEEFISDDVVIVPFPSPDLSLLKLKSALAITKLSGIDPARITSRLTGNSFSVLLTEGGFVLGEGNQENRISTSERSIKKYWTGAVGQEVLNEAKEQYHLYIQQLT